MTRRVDLNRDGVDGRYPPVGKGGYWSHRKNVDRTDA